MTLARAATRRARAPRGARASSFLSSSSLSFAAAATLLLLLSLLVGGVMGDDHDDGPFGDDNSQGGGSGDHEDDDADEPDYGSITGAPRARDLLNPPLARQNNVFFSKPTSSPTFKPSLSLRFLPIYFVFQFATPFPPPSTPLPLFLVARAGLPGGNGNPGNGNNNPASPPDGAPGPAAGPTSSPGNSGGGPGGPGSGGPGDGLPAGDWEANGVTVKFLQAQGGPAFVVSRTDVPDMSIKIELDSVAELDARGKKARKHTGGIYLAFMTFLCSLLLFLFASPKF